MKKINNKIIQISTNFNDKIRVLNFKYSKISLENRPTIYNEITITKVKGEIN